MSNESPPQFHPRDAGHAICVTKVADLLPELQASLIEARTATGWDQQKLNQVVAHEYGFLGPFVSARVETIPPEGAEQTEFLVVEFRPPQDRELEKAERLFQ